MRWLAWVAVIALGLGGIAWGVNRATTERLPDIAVRPPAGTAPAHRDTTSEINLQIALPPQAPQAPIAAQRGSCAHRSAGAAQFCRRNGRPDGVAG